MAVTGDHTTPAAYGDHSHEPVPFSIAHLNSAVAALGHRSSAGGGLEAGEAALASALAAGQDVGMPSDRGRRLWADSRGLATTAAAGRGGRLFPGPTVDAVTEFNEIAAASGALGRFPGSQVVPLLRAFRSSVPRED